MGKSLIIKGADFFENGIQTKITWLSNIANTSGTYANAQGYGWADKRQIYVGHTLTHIRFKTGNSSGFFEVGVAPSINCGLSDIVQVQTINFTSSDLDENNICTLQLNTPITIHSGEYIVLFPVTQPQSQAFMYDSQPQAGFYTDVPVSRREKDSWRLSPLMVLCVDFGTMSMIAD